jgi:hypothetical protein
MRFMLAIGASFAWLSVALGQTFVPPQALIVNPSSVLTRPATAVSQTPSTTTGQCATPFVFTNTGAQVFTNGQAVIFTTLPCVTTGPAINTIYYVTDATGNLFHLSTTTSNANNIAGSGTASSQTAFLVYSQNSLIASNYTAGSVVVPTVTAARVASGTFYIKRIRLITNATSGWGSAPMTINLWASGPTYSFGDVSQYTVATGSANWLGSFTCIMTQFADGAACSAIPTSCLDVGIALSSGQTITWDLEYTGVTQITPVASATWTAYLEDWQN